MTDVIWLRTPEAIRARCRMLYDAGLEGRLDWFEVRPDRLDVVADYVEHETHTNYPDLAIPYHSRWRHFGERWKSNPREGLELARTAADLAVVSVLLDAGAGATWRYRDTTGETLARSEGLAVASLRMFEADGFANLETLTTAQLAAGFQVTADNPLIGLESRVALLNRLGRAMRERPDVFGTPPRFGHLIDTLLAAEVPLPRVLTTLLDVMAPIWPSGLMVDGVNLGDVAEHRLAGLVPFHKLTQWLTYSLIEPFEWAGATVTELDGLTGLPEYRNGGLFVDLGVLAPKRLPDAPLDPRHPLVVEWRACTVVLLDLLAERLRVRLGIDLPLARLLQGGTWTAGRRIARERRADGSPPIAVLTDGTTF
jgi:hypothetical protein